ncbi:Uncharacterized protein conserved in bacteria (plasmid) [Tsukamurella tyrosinosolvens]|uniref:5'(3')-deoxyribonucleotidase n=1 Tax=Tsukamurella tyrosinosolvens TaxID=57704 RepID=A0A1H4UFY6_TSUTY|nr:hypothetical protein [Tsukamurella tyrosinosolvens]KXO92939.1 hypothetical protein AXK58_13800 [Tsukamurella tyrosinosolvens]SEC67278.1 5'(3')-deoxyribonucleotidase [Tsukamurella tyrosinosolvens]VEH94177.1 Uncharacterized protein conserved in bacteria [Tsukamurella tyrosinosolvens]
MTAVPLHVGIDIDGVLADYMGGVASVGRWLGLPMEGAGAGPTTYDLVEPGWFPDAQAASEAMRSLADGGLGTLSLLDTGAPAAIRAMRAAGHRVDIVTARHPGRRLRRRPQGLPHELAFRGIQDTLGWLDEHGIERDEAHFVRTKSVVGCDIYLDDAPHNIEEIRGAGRAAVVLDSTYNRHVDGPRVRTVSEFADLVLEGEILGRTA